MIHKDPQVGRGTRGSGEHGFLWLCTAHPAHLFPEPRASPLGRPSHPLHKDARADFLHSFFLKAQQLPPERLRGRSTPFSCLGWICHTKGAPGYLPLTHHSFTSSFPTSQLVRPPPLEPSPAAPGMWPLVVPGESSVWLSRNLLGGAR